MDCNINYHGFWPTSNEAFLELPFIKALPYENVKITKWMSKIDFYSVMSDKLLNLKPNKNKKIVFFTGEDVEYNYNKYQNYCLDKTDLSLGFKYESDLGNPSNYIRYPLWLCYFFPFTLDKDIIKKQVDSFSFDKVNRKKLFCLVASHDRKGIREQILKMIFSQYEEESVSCGGSFLHNDDELKQKFADNKIEYLKQFMFNICPENVSSKGYTTEKIFESFKAGCIPIYYGSNDVPEKDVINQNSLILWNGANDDEVLYKINELCNDEKFRNYFRSQKPLLNSAVDYIFERHLLLRKKYEEFFL